MTELGIVRLNLSLFLLKSLWAYYKIINLFIYNRV